MSREYNAHEVDVRRRSVRHPSSPCYLLSGCVIAAAIIWAAVAGTGAGAGAGPEPVWPPPRNNSIPTSGHN